MKDATKYNSKTRIVGEHSRRVEELLQLLLMMEQKELNL